MLCGLAQSPQSPPRTETRCDPREPGDPRSSPGAGADLCGRAAGLSPAPSIWAPAADIPPGWRARPRLGGARSGAAVNSAGTAGGWKMDINREAEGRQPERRSGSCLRLPLPSSPGRELPRGGVQSLLLGAAGAIGKRSFRQPEFAGASRPSAAGVFSSPAPRSSCCRGCHTPRAERGKEVASGFALARLSGGKKKKKKKK